MLLNPKNRATILVAPSDYAAHQTVETALQKLWCRSQENPCGCTACRMIKNRTHHYLRWIIPEQGYKIEHIQPLLHTTRFTRTAEESLVFVLDKAETFTPAVANRLLVLLEEPAEGYYFIIITKNIDAIIPTIISRCLVQTIEQNYADIPELCQVFTGMSLPPLQQFYKILRETKIDHRTSKHYFDLIKTMHIKELFKHYDHVRSRPKKNNIIKTLNSFATRLPAQGGSDLFWKLLYFSWPS